MLIRPLREDLVEYLGRRGLVKRWEKQRYLFERNPFHPSLHTEVLEPKHLKIYSFRLTLQYRVIFVYVGNEEIEVLDINDHYQ